MGSRSVPFTLVALAAGMGQRYGGLKQVEAVGPAGETILDYSVYDALGAQWQMDGTNLEDGGQFNGAVSNVLTISDVQLTNRGAYTVVITNIAGLAISSNAVLTVGPLGFANIVAAGDGSFVLSGIGGPINGTFYVLSTTDLTLPLTNWIFIATNRFDNFGDCIFTNAMQTNAPQQFYILKLPQ